MMDFMRILVKRILKTPLMGFPYELFILVKRFPGLMIIVNTFNDFNKSMHSFIKTNINIHTMNPTKLINPLGPRILLKHAPLFPGFLANLERLYLLVFKNL